MLTQKMVDGMRPGEVLNDSEVKNLSVRCFDESKSYYFFYRFEGQQRRPKIGDASMLTLSQAREAAKAMYLKTVMGEDPSLEKQKKSAEKTVSEIFDMVFEEDYSKTDWGKEAFRLFETQVKPVFGKKKISDVKMGEVRTWHKAMSKEASTQANRAKSVLSKIFSFAQSNEIVPMGHNPCSFVKANKEESRNRFASEEELKKIGEILERDKSLHPREVAFIYILAFTGARPQSIEKATWDQLTVSNVDGKEYGTLNFQGKSGKETVIIPPQAMEVLRLIVPKSDTLTGIKVPNKYWEDVRHEAGCPDLWLRDMRRTFATAGLSKGLSIGTISELLNHKNINTTKIYAKLVDKVRSEVAVSIADEMETLLGK